MPTNKLGLILMFTLLSSCGSVVPPSWFEIRKVEGYERPRYITGYASGPYFKNKGVKFVEKNAKDDIARQIRSHIKSRLEFKQFSYTRNGKEKYGDSVFKLVQEETSLVLNNVKRIKEEISEDKSKIFVALAIDRQELARKYRLEAINFIQTVHDYKDKNPERMREIFLNYLVIEKLRQKIRLSELKGGLYGSTFYKPIALKIPHNQHRDVRLTFTDNTQKEYHKALRGSLSEVFHQYGMSLADKADTEIICEFIIRPERSRKYPTASFEFRLREKVNGKLRSAYYMKQEQQHPNGYKQAKDMVLRSRLALGMKGLLQVELGQRVNKVIDNRIK